MEVTHDKSCAIYIYVFFTLLSSEQNMSHKDKQFPKIGRSYMNNSFFRKVLGIFLL